MAEKLNEIGNVPYNSPGVYTRTIDLTTVADQIGEFRGGQIGLMERGPAFEVIISNSYTQRIYRFGDLNPEFPTTYYAKQYLEQADGLREIRLLGLEGYKDTVGYVIVSGQGIDISPKDTTGVGTYDRISEAVSSTNKILAVLKARKTNFTGLPAVYSVEVEEATSPTTGNIIASDELFKLRVIFDPTSSRPDMEILCSLREDSKDYIVRKLGSHPLSLNKIGSEVCPLWVDFVDSTAQELVYDYYQNRFKTKSYYQGVLPTQAIELVLGNIEINTAAPIDTFELLNIVLTPTDVTVTVKGNVTANLGNGDGVMLSDVKGKTNTYIETINSQQYLAGNVTLTGGNTEFKLFDPQTNTNITQDAFGSIADFAPPAMLENLDQSGVFKIIDIEFGVSSTYVLLEGNVSSSFTVNDDLEFSNLLGTDLDVLTTPSSTLTVASIDIGSNPGYTRIYIKDGVGAVASPDSVYVPNLPHTNTFILPTWETEVLDFEGQEFLTPCTPWFVSEVDSSGGYKRLFKLWSISDGESANTEIKVDISEINPGANNGNGFFNLTVRTFNNRDDGDRNRIETFSNLTFDKNSENYILRRIGDGDNFPLRSRFVFVELNEDEELDNDLLPFGCLGYPNVSGSAMNDIPWTVDYDKTKSTAKQTLGIANNTINMKKKLSGDLLSFKPTDKVGKGFHINPASKSTGKSLVLDQFGKVTSADIDPTQLTILNDTFTFASSMIYSDASGKVVSQQERTRRNKFTVAFYGGFDGWNVYNERTWNDPNSKDYESLSRATALLEDSELIDTDFTVMVTPDLNIRDHSNAISLVYDMIFRRGDAVYLPDFAYDVNADVLDVMNTIEASNFKSSQIAVYHPWLQISDPTNKVNKWLPASILPWGTIANLGNQGTVWNPAGGPIKTVTNNLLRGRRRMTLEDREQLFTQNINPISKFGTGEYEIVGVKTTQPFLSALSYLHNTLLLCYAKKALKQTLRAMLFTMNNELASDQFIITVTPIFERIKRLNGLSEFKVSTRNELALNDKTTLYGVVEIVPLYPVERIIVDFILKDGELNFEQ